MLTIRPIPAFNDNYIWLITHGDSADAFVVDPGDAAVVNDALRRERLTLAGILITHHHLDHVCGICPIWVEAEAESTSAQQIVPDIKKGHRPARGGR